MNQVNELESAILARAHALAAEYRKRANRSKDNILRDAAERLHLREEREVLVAKALAERAYRRRVQSNELKLRKQMDLLRWNLVQGVLDRLSERMEELVRDEENYLPLLRAFVIQGAVLVERDQLVVEVNATDLRRLQEVWDESYRNAVPGKTLVLAAEPVATVGGAMVRSTDNRIRVDNTFEGRLQRLHQELHQRIVERLLPAGNADLGTLVVP